ncbi:Lrp/AsnC family transcriptional regulator [Flavobacterium sp. F339]|nr:Lrp/AsnC family transcriptional regulator [Flavobacterium turcicum]
MIVLDVIDKKILELVQNDSKKTTKELSIKLNLSVTAVYERVRKLEREGIIEKYVAIVNKSKVEKGFLVFCHLKLIQHSREYIQIFEKEVAQLSEVVECYHVSGDYDYILKIVVKDMEAYRQFLINKLTSLSHIGSTHSTFMIDEIKNTTQIVL